MSSKITFKQILSWVAIPAECIHKVITSPKTKAFLIQLGEGAQRFADAQRVNGNLPNEIKQPIKTTARNSRYKKAYVR